MKVLFFIRKSRLKKNGEAPVFLRITINGQQDEIRIQRSVPVNLWNNLKGCSKGKDRVSLELNSYIEALKVRLYQIHKELLCRDALITPQNMLVKLFAKEERHLVVETMKKCIEDWRSLIGQEYQPRPLRAGRRSLSGRSISVGQRHNLLCSFEQRIRLRRIAVRHFPLPS